MIDNKHLEDRLQDVCGSLSVAMHTIALSLDDDSGGGMTTPALDDLYYLLRGCRSNLEQLCDLIPPDPTPEKALSH